MSASIDELVDQMPPADQFRLLSKLADRVLASNAGDRLIRLATDDYTPVGFLLRCPPMPDTGPYTDADRAEDARRLADRDNTVSVDELISLIDFGRDDPERARS